MSGLTELAREQANGLLAEAAEQARALARQDLVDELRRAIVAEATRTPAPEHADAQPTRGLYVYAISDRAGLSFDDPAVRTVESDGLALVVAEKELDQLAEMPTDEITEDSPVAQLARQHDDVIRAAAEQATVLPMRLGIVVADDADARSLLDSRRDEARRQLSELRGRREWGLQISAEDTGPQVDGPPENATGTEYIAARRAARTAAEEQQRRRQVVIESAHDRLAKLSADTVRRSGTTNVLADIAYLVATEDEAAFQAEIEQLTPELAAVGVTPRLTGPWPPYSFVRSAEVGRDE